MKKSLATKKKLEQLAAYAIGDGQPRREALSAMVSLSEHRKRYKIASDAAAHCVAIGRAHGEKVLRQYLDELRTMVAQQTASTTAKRNSELKTLHEVVLPVHATPEKPGSIAIEDKLFALVESWSDKRTPDTLAEQVSMIEEVVDDCVVNEEDDVDNSDEDGLISEDASSQEFPLGMLLEIAAKHYHEEYKNILSESQMSFMINYVSHDPDQFIAKVLIPLEEQTKHSISRLSEDSAFGPEQLNAVVGLLEKFQADRSFVSSVSHPQHHAAIDFYLSLVDLTEKINIKGKQE